MNKTTDFGFQKVPEQEKARHVAGVFDSVAARYDLEIPVLCVDGTKAFSIAVSAAQLRRYLTRRDR